MVSKDLFHYSNTYNYPSSPWLFYRIFHQNRNVTYNISMNFSRCLVSKTAIDPETISFPHVNGVTKCTYYTEITIESKLKWKVYFIQNALNWNARLGLCGRVVQTTSLLIVLLEIHLIWYTWPEIEKKNKLSQLKKKANRKSIVFAVLEVHTLGAFELMKIYSEWSPRDWTINRNKSWFRKNFRQRAVLCKHFYLEINSFSV